MEKVVIQLPSITSKRRFEVMEGSWRDEVIKTKDSVPSLKNIMHDGDLNDCKEKQNLLATYGHIEFPFEFIKITTDRIEDQK